jgi:hypothetical protein
MFCYGTSRHVFGLRKMNEILTSDYLMPIRILSPEKPQETGAAFMEGGGKVDMSDWNRQMKAIVARHRRDPGSIHTLPFPPQYQVLGGEGKDLVPGELLMHGEDMQLNAMGVPPEFYRGTLTLQTAPMAARLFEAHWQHIPAAANTALQWIVEKITKELGWKECGVRLTPPQIADNLDHLMLLLQLMQTGQVTSTTVLGKLGLEKAEEMRRMKTETLQEAKMQSEMDPEMQKIMAGSTMLNQAVEAQRAMMAGGGAPQQGGMPAGPSQADQAAQILAKIESFGNPQVPTSPVEMQQVAQEAAAIFAFLPESEKRSKLRDVEQINPVMASLIKKEMEGVHKQKRQEMEAQGAAVMQQQGGMPMPT